MCDSLVGHQRADNPTQAAGYNASKLLPIDEGWSLPRLPLTSHTGEDRPAPQHLLPYRDRKSTGLKISKKKARRRHTDVRSQEA